MKTRQLHVLLSAREQAMLAELTEDLGERASTLTRRALRQLYAERFGGSASPAIRSSLPRTRI